MATKLHKPVRRHVGDLGLKGGDAGEFTITLYPGGVLGFRRARSRREFQVPLASCYRLACQMSAIELRKERSKS